MVFFYILVSQEKLKTICELRAVESYTMRVVFLG